MMDWQKNFAELLVVLKVSCGSASLNLSHFSPKTMLLMVYTRCPFTHKYISKAQGSIMQKRIPSQLVYGSFGVCLDGSSSHR